MHIAEWNHVKRCTAGSNVSNKYLAQCLHSRRPQCKPRPPSKSRQPLSSVVNGGGSGCCNSSRRSNGGRGAVRRKLLFLSRFHVMTCARRTRRLHRRHLRVFPARWIGEIQNPGSQEFLVFWLLNYCFWPIGKATWVKSRHGDSLTRRSKTKREKKADPPSQRIRSATNELNGYAACRSGCVWIIRPRV